MQTVLQLYLFQFLKSCGTICFSLGLNTPPQSLVCGARLVIAQTSWLSLPEPDTRDSGLGGMRPALSFVLCKHIINFPIIESKENKRPFYCQTVISGLEHC